MTSLTWIFDPDWYFAWALLGLIIVLCWWRLAAGIRKLTKHWSGPNNGDDE